MLAAPCPAGPHLNRKLLNRAHFNSGERELGLEEERCLEIGRKQPNPEGLKALRAGLLLGFGTWALGPGLASPEPLLEPGWRPSHGCYFSMK